MPQPATTPTPPHDAPDSLRVALTKYHYSQVMLDDLRHAYDRYVARQEEMRKPKTFFQSLIEGFQSFNLCPTGTHERFMSIMKHRSDADAIASYWQDVGEYLSYGIVTHIIEEANENEKR